MFEVWGMSAILVLAVIINNIPLTQNTIQPLIIGIIFLVIGFCSLFFSKKKYLSLIPGTIGVFLIFISLFGPLSKSKQRVDQLKNLDSTKITRIIVQPSAIDPAENKRLVKNEVIVIDRNTINELCGALHKTVLANEDFLKNPTSLCRVLIEIKDEKSITFGVRISGDMTSLEIDSEGESGWHFAKLKATEFGQIIKRVCK